MKELDASISFYLVLVSVTLDERYIYNKQLFIYAISDTIFQWLFPDIYPDVLDEILSNRRQRKDLKKRTHTSEKSKKKGFRRVIFKSYKKHKSISSTWKRNPTEIKIAISCHKELLESWIWWQVKENWKKILFNLGFESARSTV